jgi:hypothetical protein
MSKADIFEPHKSSSISLGNFTLHVLQMSLLTALIGRNKCLTFWHRNLAFKF